MHSRQAKDAAASKRSIFSKNHDYNNYKGFLSVAVNTCVPIFRGLGARCGRKLRTDTHTQCKTTTVTIIIKIIRSAKAHT